MTVDTPGSARTRERGRPRRGARGRRVAVWLFRLLVLAAVFWAGLVIGRALEEAPRPGGTLTVVRTLEPLPQEPPPRTVTVTVTQP